MRSPVMISTAGEPETERDDENQPEAHTPQGEGAEQHDQCRRAGDDSSRHSEREELLQRYVAVGMAMRVRVVMGMMVVVVILVVMRRHAQVPPEEQRNAES